MYVIIYILFNPMDCSPPGLPALHCLLIRQFSYDAVEKRELTVHLRELQSVLV